MTNIIYFSVFRNVTNTTHRHILVTLAFLNPGLYFVDHIHFQYNGFLFGILLYSIAFMLERKDLLGGLCFAILLNFKHIYLYLAPAYFIYLLRHYCFTSSTISFKPFLSHIPQVLSRLFPFKRGLCHAYWAPNAWALYSLLDRGLVFVLQKVLRIPMGGEEMASLTRGLVGDTKFAILPDVPPLATMIITILAQLVWFKIILFF
jgi:alpha-1,3-glucosyltransferase